MTDATADQPQGISGRRMRSLVLMLVIAAVSPWSALHSVDAAARTIPPGSTTAAARRAAAPDTVANPTVTPATGGLGRAGGGLRYDVSQFGYEEHEYFFEGTAQAYGPTSGPPAPYRTRMIVWTPADRSRFNGTTVVEWAHVSDFGQFELTVELNYQATMLQDRGYAFVLVSAEEGGVCDLGESGCTPTSLKGADPVRYATLNHPGDALE